VKVLIQQPRPKPGRSSFRIFFFELLSSNFFLQTSFFKLLSSQLFEVTAIFAPDQIEAIAEREKIIWLPRRAKLAHAMKYFQAESWFRRDQS